MINYGKCGGLSSEAEIGYDLGAGVVGGEKLLLALRGFTVKWALRPRRIVAERPCAGAKFIADRAEGIISFWTYFWLEEKGR
jgi:hypothetical protein